MARIIKRIFRAEMNRCERESKAFTDAREINFK